MKKNFLYGPCRSRRLNRSLGVDIVPLKTCSLDCVYCECGKTTCLTIERKEYYPTEEIIQSLDTFLKTNPDLDYITFAGSGEPTLHSGLGRIISFLKDQYPQYKVAVLTNATLLEAPGVINDLKQADLVVPSLDAVSMTAFDKVNRPYPGLSPKKLIEGINKLRDSFSGQIWLEIFLVPGVNDTQEELKLFKNTLNKIKADKVQLNSLDRPGAVDWIKKTENEKLKKIAAYLGNVEIIS